MITVKQYAEERGITIQAVHQSMQGKRKKDRLEGHVTVIDGVKWLDEEAVAILDESRNKSPIVYEKAEANQIIKDMEKNEKEYLRKIAEQADKIAAQAQWKADQAVAIAEATQNKLLLEGTKAELEQERKDRERDRAASAAQIAELQRQLEAAAAREKALLSRNAWQRLTRQGE